LFLIVPNDDGSGIRGEIGEVERILKALMKSLEKKHLAPCILESSNPPKQLIAIVRGQYGKKNTEKTSF
jgi:hypothetical protein